MEYRHSYAKKVGYSAEKKPRIELVCNKHGFIVLDESNIDRFQKSRCVCEIQMPPRVANSIDSYVYIKAFEK
jgi:hypothetical protein